jgi:excisionase family DNA binding protein
LCFQTHQTISGQTINFSNVPAQQIAFLEKLKLMAAHRGTTHDEMIVKAYGPENPILDPNAIPGRGAVTAEVIGKPAYRAMTDILFRKEMIERGVTAESLAECFTLTPAEVAARLGVTVSAVRQAIDAGRLGAWLKGGRVFIDPRSLVTFKLSPRGPKRRQGRPKEKTGLKLKSRRVRY